MGDGDTNTFVLRTDSDFVDIYNLPPCLQGLKQPIWCRTGTEDPVMHKYLAQCLGLSRIPPSRRGRLTCLHHVMLWSLQVNVFQ